MTKTKKASGPGWAAFARAVSDNLRRLRDEKGYSQRQLANIAGLAEGTVQRYEKGESRDGTPMNPQLKSLIALSQALETSLTDLLPQPYPDLTVGR